jgi:hypothetical protein
VAVSGFRATSVFLRKHYRRQDFLKQNGHFVRWVEFTYTSDTLTPCALDVAENCPQLKRLHGADLLSAEELVMIALQCPLLEEIEFGIGGCPCEALIDFAQHCTGLKRVKAMCQDMFEEGLVALVFSNPGLLSFGTSCENVTDYLVQALALSCTSLTDLSIGKASLQLASIYLLLRHCPSLNRLALNASLHAGAREADPEPVVYKNMRSLRLVDSDIWFDAVDNLLRCFPRLVTLSLIGCYNLVELDSLPIGTRCPALQELTLRDNGSSVGDHLLLDVSTHCPHLRVLHIPRSYSTSAEGIDAMARSCPLLEDININRCKGVTDTFLILLAENCRDVRTLSVRGCSVVTGVGVLAVMQQCKKLRELCARGCGRVSCALLRMIERVHG